MKRLPVRDAVWLEIPWGSGVAGRELSFGGWMEVDEVDAISRLG